MSSPAEAPAPEAPPPRKSRFSWLRRPSLAARAAIVLGLFLLLLVAITWTLFFLSPVHVPWRHGLWWTRIAAVLLLLILTPLTFYWAIRLWMRRYRSRFPDIDYAWKAGIQALEQHGIPFRATPLFLIIGSPGPEVEQALMQACGREFAVRGVPEGPGPIHWYANAEGIYLVCSDVGWLSRVNRVVQQTATSAEPSPEAAPAEAVAAES